MSDTARRLLIGLAWLGAVIVIALGAAGFVAGMDPPPTSAARPELTAEGDAIVDAALDASEADLDALAATVDSLGQAARTALASLNGRDMDAVEAAVADGDGIVSAVRAQSAAIGVDLAAVPLLRTREGAYQVSPAMRERQARLTDALRTTAGLDAAWARLTIGSLAATRMSDLLAAHDAAVLKAAELGRRARYSRAIDALDGADAAIADARALRDQLSNTVDVSTLDQWLDRNETYDKALRELYRALRDVGGRVTKDVRNAIDGEKEAKARLPADNRGLSVIMADIGQGGMTGAVIAIEEAKGRLVEALAAATEPEPSPS